MTRSIIARPSKILLSILLLTICSCATKKNVLYFQDSANATFTNEVIVNQQIEPNDILDVKIGSQDPVTSALYNTGFGDPAGAAATVELLKLKGYLVNDDGFVTLPVLGPIKVTDKSAHELESFLSTKLINEGHLKNPTVAVRIINAKVTVLGEVRAPGTYNFSEKNLTLLQALGLAGDLTIEADRRDVMLIRTENSAKTVTRLDMTSTDWFNTSSYYIKQNDVIVVNPNNAKVKSAGIIGNPGTVISVISLLLTAAILITR